MIDILFLVLQGSWNNYLHKISLGRIVVALLLAALVVFIFSKFIKEKKEKLYLFIMWIYFFLILCITLFGRNVSYREYTLIDLFITYIKILKNIKYTWYDVIFNVAVFIPEGIILSIKLNWKKTIAAVACTTLVIEVLQLITFLGRFEICDLIDNIIGGVIGILLVRIICKFTRC